MILNSYYNERLIQLVPKIFRWNSFYKTYLWSPIKRSVNTSRILFKKNSKPNKNELKHKQIEQQYIYLLKKNNPYTKRYRNYTYIIHDEVVDLVLKNISSDIANEDAMIIEVNPGFGLLTKALLDNGIPHFKIVEDNSIFLPYLLEISETHLYELEIINKDFYRMFKISEDKESENYLFQLLRNVKVRNWVKAPPLKIFLILPNENNYFLRKIIYSLNNTKTIYQIGRIEFLMFVSGKEYEYMIAKPKDNFWKYRQISILLQLFFHIQPLGKMPKEYFFTIFKTRKKKVFYDDKNLYLVRIIPKENIFNNDMTVTLFSEFMYFIRLNLASRKTVIIPALERLIPDCGPHFIKYGIAIYTRFGDISPNQILDIFKIFVSLPGYNIGLFKELFSDELFKKSHEESCDIETNVE